MSDSKVPVTDVSLPRLWIGVVMVRIGSALQGEA